MKTVFPRWGVGVLFIFLTIALSAQTQAAEREGHKLSLMQALNMALENNLDLISARMDPEISEQGVVAEKAGFDHAFNWRQNHNESEQEISNLFSLSEFTSDSGTASFNKTLKWGADYTLDLGLDRSEASGPLVTTPTTYEADLGFSFTLPLLGTSQNGNSLGREATTERLVLAKGNLDISHETLRLEAQRVMEEVENAYWNVVANIAALNTRRLALTRAQDLLELNKKKVEVGTLAPIEITQAEAQVASNEEQVIIADTDLLNSEDDLRRLLGIPENDPMWGAPLVPTDLPDFQPRDIDLDEAISSALMSRPEIINARQRLRNDELSERVTRKRTRPGLSLNGSVRPAGNNFETLFDVLGNPIGQEETGVFDEAVSEIQDFDNYSWSVGVNFDYVIGNRAAKSNYAVASLNRQKSAIDVQNQEQIIRVDVRKSVRSVQSGSKRIQAASKNVELQEKKLDAEQKKFENGMSTSFEVLTFQNDLADAELARIQAALDYARALTALERSKGTLLQARGLEIGDGK